MIKQIHENSLRKIMALNQIKLKSQFHPAFETGFVVCKIQERYRKMVDKVKNYQDLNGRVLWNSIDVLIMLEDVEDLFWEISHLVGMLHEIERKWEVNIPTNLPFYDKYYRTTSGTVDETSKVTQSVSMPRFKPHKEGGDGTSAKHEKGKKSCNKGTGNQKHKKNTPVSLKDFFARSTSTRAKTARWVGRLFDYGWEMNNERWRWR
ncbi:hypothetical protein NE865_15756 [Phthorimaea operculella]|nr:hypothetical protein NE865_15756 [Phthorimaea operculella]